MIYYNFINNTKKYLKSVRVIKDYISFDMTFPNTWSILKSQTKNVEVIKSKSEDEGKMVISFVSQFGEESINNLENSIQSIIKYNIEKEEKEMLFKNKVEELKRIFESQKLDNLKGLKFDINEYNLISDETENEYGYGGEDGDGEVEVSNDKERDTN